MGNRTDPDEIDDSMAANPEPEEPRAALGYATTTAPRSRRPHGDKAGRWVVEFREGAPEPAAAAPAPKKCATCGHEPIAILHSLGSSIERRHCGKCVGDYNRRRMGGSGTAY